MNSLHNMNHRFKIRWFLDVSRSCQDACPHAGFKTSILCSQRPLLASEFTLSRRVSSCIILKLDKSIDNLRREHIHNNPPFLKLFKKSKNQKWITHNICLQIDM